MKLFSGGSDVLNASFFAFSWSWGSISFGLFTTLPTTSPALSTAAPSTNFQEILYIESRSLFHLKNFDWWLSHVKRWTWSGVRNPATISFGSSYCITKKASWGLFTSRMVIFFLVFFSPLEKVYACFVDIILAIIGETLYLPAYLKLH